MSGSRRPVALLAAGWLLLALGWAIGNPQFAAPDEADHYVRAAGLAGGTLVGEVDPAYEAPGITFAPQAEWIEATARRVTIPAGLAPPPTCYVTDPRRSAACIDDAPAADREVEAVTPAGTYQPLPYLLPAAALTIAGDPAWGDRLARLAGLLPAFALLVAAALAVGVLGPLLAVTPMVLYSAATLNGSGLEIAAGVAFAAALLRATRREGPVAHWVWALVAVAGATLALSRSTGPVWALAIAALTALRYFAAAPAPRETAPPRSEIEVVVAEQPQPRSRAPWIAAGVVVAAVVANRAWEHAYGPDREISFVDPRGAAADGLEQLWGAADELVGGFGYLETQMPVWLAVLWAIALAAVLWVAARSSPARERALLAVALAGAVAIPVLVHVALLRHGGFDLQGRHVLPVLVALPLLAAELARKRPAWLTPTAAAVAALVQLGAWWSYARRSAVGTDGPVFFLPDAEWAPPGGYVLWCLVVLAGAALVAAAGRSSIATADPR